MKSVLILVLGLLASPAYAASVEVITDNNATIDSGTDIAVLDYAEVTDGLAYSIVANIYLPECSDGKVLEVKVTGTVDYEHNIVLNPSGMDTLESDAGLDAMAQSQGSARRLFCKSGKWSYLTYM